MGEYSGVARRRKVGGGAHIFLTKSEKRKAKKKKNKKQKTSQRRKGARYDIVAYNLIFFIKLLGYVQSVLKLY